MVYYVIRKTRTKNLNYLLTMSRSHLIVLVDHFGKMNFVFASSERRFNQVAMINMIVTFDNSHIKLKGCAVGAKSWKYEEKVKGLKFSYLVPHLFVFIFTEFSFLEIFCITSPIISLLKLTPSCWGYTNPKIQKCIKNQKFVE